MQPSVPEPLRLQRDAWAERPLVRMLFRRWFERIVDELAAVEGPTVELGCGIGAFKEFHPEVVATDQEPTPWAEAVVDAQHLPYDDGSVANLVMIDVFHHLPEPLVFLREAQRVLAPGGRLVMAEPYCSPLSTPLYRAFHHERTDTSVDAFAASAQSEGDPWDSNQALPTLFFWRGLRRYQAAFPHLPVAHRERTDLLLYPLSGGFTGRNLLPRRLVPALLRAERLLLPAMARLGAFRCLVVLERR